VYDDVVGSKVVGANADTSSGQALINAAYALDQDTRTRTDPVGAVAFNETKHGVHVSMCPMDLDARDKYCDTVKQALQHVSDGGVGRIWNSDFASQGAPTVASDGSVYHEYDAQVDDLDLFAYDGMPVEELVTFPVSGLTGGRVAHDVGRVLLASEQNLDPGVVGLAACAGPIQSSPVIGQMTVSSHGGQTVILTLAGSLDVIFMPMRGDRTK
jgi:hypothetical protein